jgi:hypothetical protein
MLNLPTRTSRNQTGKSSPPKAAEVTECHRNKNPFSVKLGDFGGFRWKFFAFSAKNQLFRN